MSGALAGESVDGAVDRADGCTLEDGLPGIARETWGPDPIHFYAPNDDFSTELRDKVALVRQAPASPAKCLKTNGRSGGIRTHDP
ncbi:hypothetical protein [Methylobacterium oryzisoli]|uniref:hypothetical protein n=1 Tax=Methylobacterium oryzisoli TaxID=3385502 RepID=UPI003892A430